LKESKLKKKFIIVGVIAVLICFSSLKLAAMGKEKNKRNFIKEDIGEFKLADYYIYIKDSGYDKKFGEVADSKKAREIAENVWSESYGVEVRNNYKNLLIYYDYEKDAWLVKGDIPEDMVGKIPHVLINGKDGKVLGIWREIIA